MDSLLQTLAEHVPPNVLGLLPSRKVQGAAAALGCLSLLWPVNRYLSWKAYNNYATRNTWNASSEIIVITGGSSGIGEAMVKQFEAKDLKVIILDINPPARKMGKRTSFYKLDLSQEEDIRNVADRIKEEHGHPTVLISNAGTGHLIPILSVTYPQLKRLFDINLFAAWILTQQFLPNMIERQHGHIVNVASLAAFMTQARNTDYGATKAGLLAFYEGLRQELRHLYNAPGVRTSIVFPGSVKSPMATALIDTGRFGQITTPDEVASAVVKQVISGYGGYIAVPSTVAWASMIRGMPIWIQERLRDNVSFWFLNGMKDLGMK